MAAGKTVLHSKPGTFTSRHRVRFLGNDKVTPVFYSGHNLGHGSYMTGQVNGKTVEDANGKPIPLRQIGELKNV
jgi:hypothetical protein